MEVIDPFGPELGAGDCVERSPVLSIEPLPGPDDAAVVPSEVWIFRLAAGSPDAGGAFFLLLNRKAIVNEVCRGWRGTRVLLQSPGSSRFYVTRRSGGGREVREMRPAETRCTGAGETLVRVNHMPHSSTIHRRNV